LRVFDSFGQLALTFLLDDQLRGFLVRKNGMLKTNTLTSMAV
jgi:hypothetical protein